MEHFINAYKRYADFTGRARRQEYWMFYLFYVIAYILLSIIDVVLGVNILTLIFALGSLVPSIAIAARRLHDTNRSGWWQLIALIPILGALVLLYFLVTKGTEGENRFGSDPLAA